MMARMYPRNALHSCLCEHFVHKTLKTIVFQLKCCAALRSINVHIIIWLDTM